MDPGLLHQSVFIMSSTVRVKPFMLFLNSIWHFKQDPFNLERFAVRATPQFEKTRSEGVDVAHTHNHFRAVRAKLGYKCLLSLHHPRGHWLCARGTGLFK
jgi:hypothetical protein